VFGFAGLAVLLDLRFCWTFGFGGGSVCAVFWAFWVSLQWRDDFVTGMFLGVVSGLLWAAILRDARFFVVFVPGDFDLAGFCILKRFADH
jgi:hypothetical protein